MLAALAMFGPFSIDTIFPAFPAIARELGATPIAMQQTISVYMIAYALMSLFHGPLSDSLGRRRVILAGVAGFGGREMFREAGPVLGGQQFVDAHGVPARVNLLRLSGSV